MKPKANFLKHIFNSKTVPIFLSVSISALVLTRNLWLWFFFNFTNFGSNIFLLKDFLILLLLGYFLFSGIKSAISLKDFSFWTWMPVLGLLTLHILIFLNQLFQSSDFDWSRLIYGYYFEVWWLNLLVVGFFWLNLQTKLADSKKHLSHWQEVFKKLILFLVLISTGVLGFALFDYFHEPKTSYVYELFTALEITDQTINGPIACHPAYFGSEHCRVQTFFSHPLYFGVYVLFNYIVFGLALEVFENQKFKILIWLLLILNSFLLIANYSRFILIPFGLMLITFLVYQTQGWALWRRLKTQTGQIVVKSCLAIAILVSVFLPPTYIFIQDLFQDSNLPQHLIKTSSSSEHLKFQENGIDIIQKSNGKLWLGYGLGSYGSAGRAKYQDLEKNQIYTNFLDTARQNGFRGEEFLIGDNWYFQILLNGGIVYAVLYVLLMSIPFIHLFKPFFSDKPLTFPNTLVLIFITGIYSAVFYNQLFEGQATVYLIFLSSLVITITKPKNY